MAKATTGTETRTAGKVQIQKGGVSSPTTVPETPQREVETGTVGVQTEQNTEGPGTSRKKPDPKDGKEEDHRRRFHFLSSTEEDEEDR